MSPPPSVPPQVAVVSLAIAVAFGAKLLAGRLWHDMPPVFRLADRLVRQFLVDVRTRTHWSRWLAVLAWGGLVATLHYSWLAQSLYTQIAWLDISAHGMGGAGVAGALLVGLRNEVPTRLSRWWIVLAVLAVGAGFEVYEGLCKTFWYNWSLAYYVEDTALDLAVDVVGSAVVVSLGTTVGDRTGSRDVA